MITATMTPEEIYREIMRDYKSLRNKGNVTGKIFQKEMKRKKIQHEFRSLSYKTPQHNEWQILFHLYTNYINTAFYIKAWDKIGISAYNIQFRNQDEESEDYFIIKFNTHFFKRYNERMVLGLTEPSKILAHFFKNNFDFYIGQSELFDDGTRYIHFIFEEGIGIGWQDDVKKTTHMKTFISNKTLNEKQLSLAEHIKKGNDTEEFQIVIKQKNMQNKI
jgi:hypothetical protein